MLILERLNRPRDKCLREQRGESRWGEKGGGADNDRGHKLQNHPMTTPYTGKEASLLVRRNFGTKKKMFKKTGWQKEGEEVMCSKKVRS